MSTSPTQSTKSFSGCHESEKELRTPVEKTPRDLLIKKLETIRDKALQYLLNKKLRTSVGEQDADGKTFLVGWQNLSRPTNPPTVFCLARVVDSVHQASVGEQDADGKLVCCDWALVVGSVRREGCVVDSVHQASVGEQDAGGKPVCCDWAPAVDGTNQYAFREDCVVGSVRREGCVVGSVHQASVGKQDTDDKPVCCVRLKLDEKNPSSDDDDDDLYE